MIALGAAAGLDLLHRPGRPAPHPVPPRGEGAARPPLDVYGILGGIALVISMTAATVMVVDYLYGGAVPLLVGGRWPLGGAFCSP